MIYKNIKNFKLNLSNKDKFVLLGSGFHLCYLANLLIKNNFPKPIIVTHLKKNHERDKLLLKDKNIFIDVFKFAKKNNIKIIETNNCNSKKIINFFKNKKCVAFSLSCRNILKKSFLDQFLYIFNLHPSILPHEKGGGTFSWRIMNNSKEISATLHLVNTKIDGGDVLLQKKMILKKKDLLPRDYLIKTNQIYKILLEKFIKMIVKNKTFKKKIQSKKSSYYLPRLNTEINGVIDWNWNIIFLERFIRAFSKPYPGAHTFINKKKFIVKKAKIKKLLKDVHPFCFGRIININNNYYEVLCNGGIIKIFKQENLKIKVTDIFYTPTKIINNSKRIIKVNKFKKKIHG